MEIYLIGALFTLGHLITIDNEYKIKKFKGFKGGCTLFVLILIWPVSMGSVLTKIKIDIDDNQRIHKDVQKDAHLCCAPCYRSPTFI